MRHLVDFVINVLIACVCIGGITAMYRMLTSNKNEDIDKTNEEHSKKGL